MAKVRKNLHSSLNKSPRYAKLLEEISGLLRLAGRTGSQAQNETKLNSYWQIGKRLHRLRSVADIFINQLARDIRVDRHILHRAHYFFETWSDGITREGCKLSWRSLLALNGITNVKERDFYVDQVVRLGWNDVRIRQALKDGYYAAYCGAPDDAGLARESDPLNVYKAHVQSVVDGDTLVVKIDLGFETWSEKRLRLRGINASELGRAAVPSEDASRAERAKSYIVEQLKDVSFVVIKTYKTDIYARFIADVYYHPKFTDKREVAKKGRFLNQELLNKGLADRIMM